MLICQNRRRHSRVPLLNPILGFLKLKYFERKIEKSLLVNILDISPGGMKIRSPYYLPLNKKVALQVFFKLAQAEFEFEGRLVWHKTEEAIPLYGFEFMGITKSVERKLIECLKREGSFRFDPLIF